MHPFFGGLNEFASNGVFVGLQKRVPFRTLEVLADNAAHAAEMWERKRTRAEVNAEAVAEAHTHSMEPAGSRVVTYK